MPERDGDISARPSQGQGGCPAQPPRRTRHQRRLPFERTIHRHGHDCNRAWRSAFSPEIRQGRSSIPVSAFLATLRLMLTLRKVVVYSRKGCHLCEIVKETLVKLERRGGFHWQEIDVDSDDRLRRQFTDEVPVVFIDGRKAFKYRMDERDFLRKLDRQGN